MKSIDLFCASRAATAICSGTDHRATLRHGETPAPPCSSRRLLEPSRRKNNREVLRRKSSADARDLAAAHDSSRHLLGGGLLLDLLQDSVSTERPLVGDRKRLSLNISPTFRPLYESPPSSVGGRLIDHLNAHKSWLTPRNRHQVVELRVSIHCKGCEGKLRKHISRMEGVRSFSIDLETKKVRVIGNVTPLDVLTSISKVKNAQFWPSPTSSPPPT